eukprot:2360297-Rhodomonas_salina.3
MQSPVLRWRMVWRLRCAMSVTDIAYGVICLRVPYAMSGTDLAYGATPALIRLSDLQGGALCSCSLRGARY